MPSLRTCRCALLLPLLILLQQIQPCSSQGGAHPELRKPVYQRLRRLDEQFRRFQELTLSRLESISQNHSVSSDLEARFQSLTDQYHSLSLELTQLRDTTAQEMDALRDWSRKLQKKSKRMEGRLASLERGLRESGRQAQRQRQEQGETLSNLTLELHTQEGRLGSFEAQQEEVLVGLRGLQESLREQALRIIRLEGRVGEILQGNGVSTRGSRRTGDPLTSNLTPYNPEPPRRTQTSRGQGPRTSTRTQPEHTRPQPEHTRPQSQSDRQPNSYPQTRSQPNLHTQANPQPQPQPQPQTQTEPQPQPQTQTQNQPKRTKDRKTRIHHQPPPLHPTQPPTQPQEQERRKGERSQQGPWPGPPQQGTAPQSVEERREEGEIERRRGREQWERSKGEEEEMERIEEVWTDKRREEEQMERRREKVGTERKGEEEVKERRGTEPQIQNLLHLPLRHKIPLQHVPKKEATICNVDSMIHFPSASSENYVTFSRSFPDLPELSVCLWLRVSARYVGTLLSYATEDNDNTLVLYGRNSTSDPASAFARAGTLDFVVGDPAYRELPVNALLDGHWHHLCVLWSSIEGRFWHYTDRRLTSMGSKFRKGYEVPGGGSVVLGQEQDSVGGGFDPVEGFVGQVAGLVVWDRVLSPGEVMGVATGRGVPRGVVLTLEDVAGVHGAVQQVACECLEHCV